MLKVGVIYLAVLCIVYSASWMCVIVGLVVDEVKDKKDRAIVVRVIRTAVMSKQYGLEDFLAGLVTDACSKCHCISGITVLLLFHHVQCRSIYLPLTEKARQMPYTASRMR